MYPPAEHVSTEVFARLPEALHLTDKPSSWLAARHVKMHSFLEGPSFDREGRLWCVDLAHGRILRVDAAGQFEVIVEYEGEPNGLKIHKDGRVFVADHLHGVMVLDPNTRAIRPVLQHALREASRA